MNEPPNFKRYVLTVDLDAATPEQDDLLRDMLRNLAKGFYDIARRGHKDNEVHVHLDMEEPVMQASCGGGSAINDFIASQRKAKESDAFEDWFKHALGNGDKQ